MSVFHNARKFEIRIGEAWNEENDRMRPMTKGAMGLQESSLEVEPWAGQLAALLTSM